ncbi:MAG: BRO family protein [Clostridium sp.]|uniref:BRO family protein n=1 Tax=Clostridium sp. TaxID=1506 RepID=UPI0039E8C885
MSNNLSVIDERVVLGKDFKVYGTVEEPLFLAKDVAECIEYSTRADGSYRTGTMINCVDNDEKVFTAFIADGRRIEAWFLTEDGLYEVLMQSRKPIAKEFKKQVKHILKTIRRNGMYATDELLDNPDLLIKAGQKLKEEKEARLKAEAERAEAEKQQKLAEEAKRIAEHEKAEAEEILEKQKPKVEFYDDFMKAGETCSTTELAKYVNQSMGLNTTATEVNKVLLALGVFNKRVARRWDEKTQKYKSTGKYILNKKFESKGWHKYVMNKDSKTGKNFTQTRWTNKGIHGVIQLFEVEREKLKLKYSA